MPKPIVCLSDQLRQCLAVFRTCFSKRQWRYFVIVLLALIECEERRTMTGLLRTIGERVSLSGLSRFLNKWPWSPDKLADAWCQRFRRRLMPLVQAEHQRLKAERPKCVGRPKATVVTGYLVFDDSVHVKPKGRKMGGQGRHFSSTEQRVVNGHCLVTGLYLLLDQRCPLPARMYRQKAVCQREGVPFVSKVDMVVQEIQRFEPAPDTHTHVLIDSWYHCRGVRRAAQTRGWDVSGGLKAIETFFEYDKDLLGSDHYQVMTANAIIRFWTLTACLLCFLEEQRATALEPGLTCGDVRRQIQEEHRRNLLYWLQAQFQAGRTVDDIGIQLAVSSS